MHTRAKAATLTLFLTAIGWAQTPPKLVFFDAPGAGDVFPQGTFPGHITRDGVIAGDYVDSSNAYHGFLRTVNGVIISIDVPGAARTYVTGINQAGVIAGYYGAGNLGFGYLRYPDGVFTTFRVPGSPATYTGGINSEGMIVGSYTDAAGAYHGFERCVDGMIVTFDAPGAGHKSGQGTSPASINLDGAIVGSYQDPSRVNHGFLRTPDGTFTLFDAPNAGASPNEGTFPSQIDAEGVIAGFYTDAFQLEHGFLRSPSGEITSVDVPPAVLPAGASGIATFIDGLNLEGALVGSTVFTLDPNPYTRAFLRKPNGEFTTFGIPGAGFYGTTFNGINSLGDIVGSYGDTRGAFHGFLVTP